MAGKCTNCGVGIDVGDIGKGNVTYVIDDAIALAMEVESLASTAAQYADDLTAGELLNARSCVEDALRHLERARDIDREWRRLRDGRAA